MNKWLLFLIVLSLNATSQEWIQKTDGKKIVVSDGSIKIQSGEKKVQYQLPNDKNVYRVKFDDLDYASYAGYQFRMFNIKQKRKGYFVIGESGSKKLLASSQKRISSAGGFDSSYTLYEVVVLGSNNAIKTITFTNKNSGDQVETRRKIIEVVKTHFQECPKLLEKIGLFESPSSDVNNTTILVFFNSPAFIECR